MLNVSACSGFGGGAAAGRPAVTDAPDQSGILLHFRADTGITLNGSDVSAWADQSTGGFDLTQGTAGRQPAFSAAGGPNGTEAVDFAGVTGGDGDLQNTAWSHANPVHYFLVFKINSWGDSEMLFTGTASHSVYMQGPGNPSNTILTMTATPGALILDDVNYMNVGTWYLGSFYYSDSYNSGSLNNATPDSNTDDFGPAAKLAMACNTAGTGVKGDFDISEFLAYDEQKTSGDLTAINKYFNDQYALF
jgi:hypothetical protein